jgi:hypothetical protein
MQIKMQLAKVTIMQQYYIMQSRIREGQYHAKLCQLKN